ncbi:MAG: hypothetical protein MUF18_07535 [Fimbriiglobus sp.]|jgi:hypothetical protein|nr:hypothetical protein [Fimbriiglobus sp.]
MKHLLLSLLFLGLPLLAADPVISGTAVGKRPGPYSFLIATGPQKGQQTCYICEQGDKPTAVVFARTLTDPLAKLLTGLDAETTTRKDSGFKAWMTQLTATADLDKLSEWAKKQGIKSVAVGGFEDADGPPAYKLHADADVTVLLFVKQKVVSNFAFRSGELTDAKVNEVLKSVPKLFEKADK